MRYTSLALSCLVALAACGVTGSGPETTKTYEEELTIPEEPYEPPTMGTARYDGPFEMGMVGRSFAVSGDIYMDVDFTTQNVTGEAYHLLLRDTIALSSDWNLAISGSVQDAAMVGLIGVNNVVNASLSGALVSEGLMTGSIGGTIISDGNERALEGSYSITSD